MDGLKARTMKKLPTWAIPALIGMIFITGMLVSVNAPEPTKTVTVPYSAFKALVEDGEVAKVTFKDRGLTVFLKRPMSLGEPPRDVTELLSEVPAIGDPEILPLLEEKGIEIRAATEPKSGYGWLGSVLPWLLLFGIYFWFWNRMQRNMMGHFGGRDANDFLAGAATREEKGAKKVMFNDVAGQDNAKREVSELVDFLREPDRYRKLGAEPPRGVLLMGPPGTGKTLLARALAGEAGVPFFHISASEFIEMFVGVGASRVRKMFDEAKNRAPSIIFIDELDSVGRVRGAGLGGGHDEREQTLNQILAELDGFSGREAVIVLAATNRPDVLDPALLRPGRFDRHVTLELPDREARKAILEVHTRHTPLANDIDLGVIASGTPGFSGADLKNLVNEAAMSAARAGASAITMQHLEEMRDKVMMGSVRTLAIQPEEHHRLAVHEAGHTVVALHLPLADPVYKVTIIPRGQALGGTHMLPEIERHTLPEDYLKARLAVLLGGRTAERVLLGTVSSGADDDIKRATQLARAMVARWGMSQDIGPVDLRQSDEHPFLGREIAQPRHFSETTAHEVDEAVHKLLGEAEQQAVSIVDEQRGGLERLIAALEQQETLERAAIDACFSPGQQARSVGAAE